MIIKCIKLFILGLLLIHWCGCDKKSTTQTIDKTTDTPLKKYGIAENTSYELGGLKEGMKAPQFDKPTHLGDSFNLQNELKNGPVVLIFYRGYWCPVCHRHLSQFQEELYLLKEKGVTVDAVTPEQFELVEKTVEKDKLTIPVIYDADESIMKDYKVAFEVTEGYQKKVKLFLRQDIASNNGSDAATLPIPATYIIGKNGEIIKTFYDPNYKVRASVQDILKFL